MSAADDLEYVEVFSEDDDVPTPRIADIEFGLYGPRTQPVVAVDTEERYADKEPIGEDPVKQYMGPGFTQVTITGECTSTEASKVDELEGGTDTYVRTARWSGYAAVETTSTESLGKYYEGALVYKYTVELTAA